MKIVETKFYGQLIVVSDYILLGILWVIVCLPVITIVPATCAVFYVTGDFLYRRWFSHQMITL